MVKQAEKQNFSIDRTSQSTTF